MIDTPPPRVALVTGGAGFLGAALLRDLRRAWPRTRLVVVDALSYAGRRASIEEPLAAGDGALVVGDVADRALVDEVLARERPDAVFHLAAETHVDRSIDDPTPFFRTNVDGTLCLLEAVRAADLRTGGRTRVVHVSTDEVLGEAPPGVTFDEGAGCAPRSPYAASKAAGEHVARAWHTTYGLHVVVVRPANLYGPRQFPEKLIPLVALEALAGRPLPVYGDGGAARDWLHVDDAAAGLRAATAAPAGAIYHLATGHERTVLEVVHAVCDAVDARAPRASGSARGLVTFVADRPGHDRRYGVGGDRARRELGWAPRIAFDEGVRATVDWLLANTTWVEGARHDRRRLGLGLAGPRSGRSGGTA